LIGQDTTSLLRIEHLFKSFQNRLVLNDINLQISPNSVFGLLGPNGVGKTTFLKIIAGLLRPSSGNIQKGNIKIGYCPQTPVFWKNLTSREQLIYNADLYLLPRKKAKKRIQFLMKKLGLLSYENVTVERLSGGMQKRLNLAMGLIQRPKLLLLDEPTANLDLESKQYVRELLLSLVKEEEITILCSSHDLDEIASISTDLLFLNQGQIVYQKKINQKKSNKNTFKKLKELYFQIQSNQGKK
jgi:ABC-2 type transport system ATP-binding protein